MNLVKTGTSNIHGIGLFSNKNLKKGDTILTIKGSVKNTKDLSDDFIRAGHWQGLNEKECLIAEKKETPFGFINHSQKPNACVDLVLMKVIATSDIQKNTEITLDYSIEPMDTRCRKLLGKLKPC